MTATVSRIEIKQNHAIVFMNTRRHWEAIGKIIDSGALDLKSGKVILHKDGGGNLKRIDFHHTIYRE